MGAIGNYFAAIGRTIMTLGDGLAVTFSYLLRKPTTLQYPDRMEKNVIELLPERSRGILEVDITKCTGCGMCGKSCPIDCIQVTVEKDDELKKRFLKSFRIDVSKCMFCGICVENCPVSCIRHSHEFEGAMYDVTRLHIEFVDERREVAKPPKKDEPVEFLPLGSIVRKHLAGFGDVFRAERKLAGKRRVRS